MAFEFQAETDRQTRALGVTAASGSGSLQPVAERQLGRTVAPVAQPGLSVLGEDWPRRVREIGAQRTMLDASFPNYAAMWPMLGRRSFLAVLRNAFLLIKGREPTLDECDTYLDCAVRSRLNAAELHYLIAVHSNIPAPRSVLTRNQLIAKVLAYVGRRIAGGRGVPFRFSTTILALDAFVLDAMRLTVAATRPSDKTA